MSLTPEQIADPHLPRAKMGGYGVEETDEFLKQVAWEWRRLESDRRKLSERTAELEQQLEDIHRRIAELRGDAVVPSERDPRSAAALAAAYRAAEAIRDDARRESETLLKKARKRVATLDNEVERAKAATADRLRELEETQRQARRRLSSFLSELLDAVEAPDSDVTRGDVVRELRARAASTAEAAPAESDR
jgi:cell division septum initiation protein DivIVA